MERLMPGIDERFEFHPLSIAVLTVSDTRTMETDTSGGLLVERLVAAGHRLAARALVPDDVAAIRGQVQAWVDDPEVDVILTTGGTGFAPRDVTPEAVRPLLRREMDGFSVVFHQASQTTVGLSTLQSRAFAGQAGDSFVFCLPGSTGACRDAWDLVLGLELDSRYRPCSLAGQIPRLRELCA
jgi:molybdenum cofactor biosynthesis protein B